jgi:hypothetical protein
MIKSKMMRWEGHAAHMGEMRNVYKILVGKPEGRRQFGRPRHRWEDNIRMDRVRSCELDSAGSGYGPVAGSYEHGNEPSGSIKGEEFK